MARKKTEQDTGNEASTPAEQAEPSSKRETSLGDVYEAMSGKSIGDLMRTPPPKSPGTMDEYLRAKIGIDIDTLMRSPHIR